MYGYINFVRKGSVGLYPVSFVGVGDNRPTFRLCAVVRSDAQLLCTVCMRVRVAIVSHIPLCLDGCEITRWGKTPESPAPVPSAILPCLLFSCGADKHLARFRVFTLD